MSETARSRLKVSREGIVLIKSFEGFRPRAVLNEEGRWTIGYGHTASAREGLTVGEQDAELLLQYDLLPVVKALNERVAIPLNQHQFDALASFAVSVGVERFLESNVLQRLNAGHAGEAADALIGWPEPPAPDSALRRRAAERALFVADPQAPIHLADLLAAPLPPPLTPSPPAASADARAAAVAALLGEAPAPDAAASASPAGTPPTTSASGNWAPQEPAFLPPAQTSVHQRFFPYAGVGSGPLPGFPVLSPAAPQAAEVAAEPVPEASAPSGPPPTPQTLSEPPLTAPPAQPDEPDSAAAGPAAQDFVEPLVLTPAVEADFVDDGREPWGPDQRGAPPPAGETELFDDEASLSVLRHESDPAVPRRFGRGETGAFLIMGMVGLGACAAAAASFRKAMTDDSFIGDFTLIGWVLALIGLTCVGISSWNLYRRWGRPD